MHALHTSTVLIKYHVFSLFVGIYFEETCEIFATVAVVRRRPYGYYVFVFEVLFVALLNQLVGSCYQSEIIVMVELINYFCSEKPTYSSTVLSPAIDILGIWPHQITHRPFSRYFLLPIEFPYLIEGMYLRWKSSMHTKNLIYISW